MKINETLLKRYIRYVEVLKKEIVLVKNVVKNPDIMKNILRTLNYSELELYKYRSGQHEDVNKSEIEVVTSKRNHKRNS